jgi:hypothetical protein
MQHATLTAAFYALAPAAPAHHPKSFHAFGVTHHFTGAQVGVLFFIVLGLILLGCVLRWRHGSD